MWTGKGDHRPSSGLFAPSLQIARLAATFIVEPGTGQEGRVTLGAHPEDDRTALRTYRVGRIVFEGHHHLAHHDEHAS